MINNKVCLSNVWLLITSLAIVMRSFVLSIADSLVHIAQRNNGYGWPRNNKYKDFFLYRIQS